MNEVSETDYKLLYEDTARERDLYREKFIQLEQQIAQLQRMIFGSRHERFVPATSPEQLLLGFEETPQQKVPSKQEKISYTRNKPEEKKQPHRLPLPAHLPRERVEIHPEEDVTGLRKIGEEITEVLELIPGKLFVRELVRVKYAKADGNGVLIGELPSRPIEKGIAGPGLLAQMIIDKYCDHLPVYRQLERFKREGVTLASSTVGDWISQTCELLSPLYDTLRKKVLSADYLQADETPIKVLDKEKKGSTHRGYHWVYHSPIQRLVLFDYKEGRGREGPKEMLKTFSGYLQSDGYAVYDDFDGKNGISLLNCFAHVRRKFDQALDNDHEHASNALSLIQQLYSIEREIKDLSEAERLTTRKEKSVYILDELFSWMESIRRSLTPKSSFGEAINYALARKQQLYIYTTDARLHIDNNLIENTIRPVAIGRKNYLFAGSHEGARRAAMLYSFLGTCKLHQINPFEWLRDTLAKIPSHPANRLEELLPNNYQT